VLGIVHLMFKMIYICTNCNSSFESSTARNHKNKFCSFECRMNFSLKSENCATCMKEIILVKNHIRKNYFCSKKCYHEWQSKNITPPQNEARLLNCNSPKAIAKRKRTWIKQGRVLDYTKFDEIKWKDYWKRVDTLTFKMRKAMLLKWNGYDYYDNEYIRDNLKLPYFHKDYPTLDHIISRTEGFKLNFTPEEITVESNLVWTKRSLNASKSNKLIENWKNKPIYLEI
jgi:hypothetical protein